MKIQKIWVSVSTSRLRELQSCCWYSELETPSPSLPVWAWPAVIDLKWVVVGARNLPKMVVSDWSTDILSGQGAEGGELEQEHREYSASEGLADNCAGPGLCPPAVDISPGVAFVLVQHLFWCSVCSGAAFVRLQHLSWYKICLRVTFTQVYQLHLSKQHQSHQDKFTDGTLFFCLKKFWCLLFPNFSFFIRKMIFFLLVTMFPKTEGTRHYFFPLWSPFLYQRFFH